MADFSDDHRLEEARAIPIGDVVAKLEIEGLKRGGHELIGPCPECGGTDRFGVNLRKGLFQCRRCGAKGDGIAMVRWLRQMSLPEALTWLCGPSEGISDKEREERRSKAKAARQRTEREAAKYRREAMKAAHKVWSEGLPAEDTPVRGYLTRRGIIRDLLPEMPKCLRYHPECRYMVPDEGGWREAWRGPAMLAAIQGPDGKFIGLHRTWIDLDQPKGKIRRTDPVTGAPLDAKKTLGAKKGGAIRLSTPAATATMIVGEGIETSLTAAIAGVYPDAAIWCGIDLGNMAGRRSSGKGLKYAGLPDLEDLEAWVPPDWVQRLIFIQDGDSEPRLTRAQLESGLRRAMKLRPGLRGQIIQAGKGRDLNDIVMEVKDD